LHAICPAHHTKSFWGNVRIVYFLTLLNIACKVCAAHRKCIGCLELQVSFRRSATTYRALLREMTDKDTASSASSPLCISCAPCEILSLQETYKMKLLYIFTYTHAHAYIHTFTYAHNHIFTSQSHIHIFTCTHTFALCTCTHTFTHTHTHTHAHRWPRDASHFFKSSIPTNTTPPPPSQPHSNNPA